MTAGQRSILAQETELRHQLEINASPIKPTSSANSAFRFRSRTVSFIAQRCSCSRNMLTVSPR